MKPGSYKLLLPAVLALLLFCYACKKNKTTSGSTKTTTSYGPPYIINCTGSMHVGDTLNFSSNIPPGVKVNWVFRNNNTVVFTSTDVAPKYAYTVAGACDVYIIIDGDSQDVKRLNPIFNFRITYKLDAATINKIGGTKYWDVVVDSARYYNYNQFVMDTLSRYEDTFAVSVIDPYTVVIKNDTLKGWYFDKTNGVEEGYTFEQRAGFYYKILVYYFKEDRLVYYYHPDQGGQPAWGNYSTRYYGKNTIYTSHK